MNLLGNLYNEVPMIQEALYSSKWVKEPDQTWALVRDFMDAHSPTASIALPGTIIDTLTANVEKMGLTDHYASNFNGTGNAAILLGEKKDHIDVLIDAHLDKPTFGVAEIEETRHTRRATLFACCANRFPTGIYRVSAKVLRYDETRQAVTVCGRGEIVSHREKNTGDRLFFEPNEGEIDYTDMVALDVPPRLENMTITGSGVDDASGVTVVLVTASIIKAIEPLLKSKSLNCLFTFSDNEEWPPESFFSLGASKTTFSLEPPTFGSIVVDVHQADEGYHIKLGRGLSCGFISAQGKGAAVPLNYQRLTTALIADLAMQEPGIAQHNTSYFSRSDDYALIRWSRILGLFGIPALNIHRGNEEGHLGDVRGGIILLSHYIPFVLCLSQAVAAKYHLNEEAQYPLHERQKL